MLIEVVNNGQKKFKQSKTVFFIFVFAELSVNMLMVFNSVMGMLSDELHLGKNNL